MKLKELLWLQHGSSSPNFKGEGLKISEQNNWGDLSKKLNFGGGAILLCLRRFRFIYIFHIS